MGPALCVHAHDVTDPTALLHDKDCCGSGYHDFHSGRMAKCQPPTRLPLWQNQPELYRLKGGADGRREGVDSGESKPCRRPGSSSGTPGDRLKGQKARRKTGRRPSALGGRSSECGLLLRSPGFCTRLGRAACAPRPARPRAEPPPGAACSRTRSRLRVPRRRAPAHPAPHRASSHAWTPPRQSGRRSGARAWIRPSVAPGCSPDLLPHGEERRRQGKEMLLPVEEGKKETAGKKIRRQ
ncbi:hypothetical protein GQ55_5G363700 [Panicum hallii var. hallii]|uniref:Uncharacterized protein n=1 Tax=Panicum hallii var. hallii TaxID=1504633 RepID=A0A2T7DMH7_9POAL|nr:hypothetical protein GQ55_5G363700 [Panicum hallii var. hallii]